MRESELLYTHVLGCNRSELYFNREQRISSEQAELLADALRRRAQGEPLQYILGEADFMGFSFVVTPEVLIPRPETELLVERVVRDCSGRREGVTILDVGTGSGCIAIALARMLAHASITAVDICPAALRVAQENARTHTVCEKVRFMQSDFLTLRPTTCLPAGAVVTGDLRHNTFDIIVCNPPYIASAAITALQPEVRREPRIALDGGADGLECYRAFLRQAPQYLAAQGRAYLEIGYGQAAAIRDIVAQDRSFTLCEVIKDYAGIERIIVLQKRGCSPFLQDIKKGSIPGG